MASLLILVALCGCVPAEAIRQAENNMNLNRANAEDASLDPMARKVSLVNADAWRAQLYLLDSDKEPSQETRDRVGE